MIVDASAILAILLGEKERADFEVELARNAGSTLISGVNYWEVEARLRSLGLTSLVGEFERLMQRAEIGLAIIDHDQTRLACEAHAQFGKGRHPAKLNLGDCFAYALAKSRGETLLFKGDDFRQTDVEPAI